VKTVQPAKLTGRKFVAAHPSKCTGCGTCEYVCALEKGEAFWNPLKSRIRVVRLIPFFNAVMTCRFCENAPCVIACPRKALLQSEGSGILITDEDKCDACGWCIEACPYGGITIHPDKATAVACDLCQGEPKCVEFCPEEALELVSDDEAVEKIWIASTQKLPLEIERITKLMKEAKWTEIFSEAEESATRLTEKLAEIDRRASSQRHS